MKMFDVRMKILIVYLNMFETDLAFVDEGFEAGDEIALDLKDGLDYEKLQVLISDGDVGILNQYLR
jgi:hypothetical protein